MSQPRTEEAVRGHFSYVVLNNTTKKRLGLFLPHQTSQDIHQKLPRSPILNPPKNIDRPSVLILKNIVEMKNNRSWCSVGLSNAYKLFIFLSNCRVVRSMATRLFSEWLVGYRIKRCMTTSVAVEMDKPIRRGFALGESSGQWENGTANAQVIGTISPLLAEASPFSSNTDCEPLEMCTGWMIKIFSKLIWFFFKIRAVA